MSPSRLVAPVVLVAALVTSPAAAEWRKVGTTHKDDLLAALSVPDDRRMYVGGMRLEQMGGFPVPSTVLYMTQDRGLTWTPIVTNLAAASGGFFGGVVSDIAFLPTKQGWTLLGDSVFRTDSAGGQWKRTKLGKTPRRIRMFDEKVGVAVGEKGATWRTEDGGETFAEHPAGTEANLDCMHWLDRDTGFAAGVRTSEEDDPETLQTKTSYHEAVLLSTTDGGRSWKVATAFEGRSVCPLFFLADGRTGFLAAADQHPDMGRPGPAYLFKTTDGGATWTDMKLDVKVGIGMFGMPIMVSYFMAMHWTDAEHGVIGGDAYVADTGGSGGASTPPIYRVVDFRTIDGGTTWDKTDLGTIQISLGGGGQMPPTDGRVLAGRMLSGVEGFMAGETGAVFAYEYACKDHAECGLGYACGADGRCIAVLTPEGCKGAECQGDDRPATEDGAAGGPDAVGPDGGSGAPSCPDGACPEGPAGGSCGAGAAGPWWIALVPAFAVVARRRSRS
jgi:photosystem II stability/assembly factor-like uncharacterized protein